MFVFSIHVPEIIMAALFYSVLWQLFVTTPAGSALAEDYRLSLCPRKVWTKNCQQSRILCWQSRLWQHMAKAFYYFLYKLFSPSGSFSINDLGSSAYVLPTPPFIL